MRIEERINTISKYYKSKYAFRVFKIGLSTGIKCPKKAEDDDCVFCVRNTYMDEKIDSIHLLPIHKQIDFMKNKIKSKVKADGFIAYFQDGTSFYGDKSHLISSFVEADEHPDILGLIISTRPDFINAEMLNEIKKLKKSVLVEIGLQSISDKSLAFLNRGHSQLDNQNAVDLLYSYNIPTGVHVILGIPGEDFIDTTKTANWINTNKGIVDVKIHHLAVYRGSKLEQRFIYKDDLGYDPHRYDNDAIISLEQYIELLALFVSHLRKDLVISRLFTSNLNKHMRMLNDFPGVKREWLNLFEKYMTINNITQGCNLASF
jgi:radical SAM protein (TIGR01212 family)